MDGDFFDFVVCCLCVCILISRVIPVLGIFSYSMKYKKYAYFSLLKFIRSSSIVLLFFRGLMMKDYFLGLVMFSLLSTVILLMAVTLTWLGYY